MTSAEREAAWRMVAEDFENNAFIFDNIAEISNGMKVNRVVLTSK